MEDITKILNDEKYNLELKEQVNFKEPKKYLKAISSFANGYDVGYLIFGVQDATKKIIGVKDIKKSYEEVSNRIKTRIAPNITPIIDIVNFEEKKLIVIKVMPGQHTPYYYVNKGTKIAYIRKGDQDCETSSIELSELILRGKNIGWDEQLTDKLYNDFTFNIMKKYFKEIKGYNIDKNTLESFNLIKNDKLTNAALLYSDQNPVVGSFIACTRWNGIEKNSAKDDIEYYGSILNQLDNAMEFIKKHMSNGWIKEGGNLARREIPEYDLDALREAIINAEAHRQYLMRGTNIEIGFYDDRIEIISCGNLGYGRTIEELLEKPMSERRNPLICDVFSRLDFMERRGSGIAKINQAYEHDKKRPKFEMFGEFFSVTFYSRLYKDKYLNNNYEYVNYKNEYLRVKEENVKYENVDVNNENVDVNNENVDVNNKNVDVNIERIKKLYPELQKTSIKIIELINENNKIKQKEIAKKLNKSTNTIYRNIKKLKELKIIERVGSDKKGYWIIKSKKIEKK